MLFLHFAHNFCTACNWRLEASKCKFLHTLINKLRAIFCRSIISSSLEHNLTPIMWSLCLLSPLLGFEAVDEARDESDSGPRAGENQNFLRIDLSDSEMGAAGFRHIWAVGPFVVEEKLSGR